MHYVQSKGLLSSLNGMNIYRGCSHGCIYCDSRSRCYGFKHDFEDIEVKENAPELLERALRTKRKKCMIGTGSMCDPYLHIEEKLNLTRRCLELINQYEYGVAIQTKSSRVLRDIDLIDSINQKSKAVIQMTMTTFDEDLCKILEPNVSTTKERFETLKQFKERKVPIIVWLSPILPFINDTEENIANLLNYCIELNVKGIICFNMGVTLRDGDREYFYEALDKNFPGLKNKYIKAYGNSYDVISPNNTKLMGIFNETCDKYNILKTPDECFKYLHEFPERYVQQSIFDMQ